MGLANDIATLEERERAGQNVADELAIAYAEMVVRKSSKRLISSWYRNLEDVMKRAGRYQELVSAANGCDPDRLGVWDCQAAVETWLQLQ